MILALDKILSRTMHRSLIPSTEKLAKGVTKIFPLFLVLFVALLVPVFYGYEKTNNEVYYDLSESLPKDMANVVANTKLQEDFDRCV